MPAFHTLTFIYTINILFVRNCKLYILYSFEIHPYLRGEKFKNHTTICCILFAIIDYYLVHFCNAISSKDTTVVSSAYG